MHPFGSAPLLDLDDDGDVDISYGGVVDRKTAASDDVVLWDDDATIACTILAVAVRGGRITIVRVPAAAA
jgi:hypothetical protein